MNTSPPSMTGTQAPPSLDEARWFPLTYDAPRDCFGFAELDLGRVEREPFLDQRLGDVWKQAVLVPAAGLDPSGNKPPSWLFHTAFCCSTLLARALHAPPTLVSLKEPYALMALAQASLHEDRLPTGLLDARLSQCVRLLGRPWHPDGQVLVKPSNAVNRLLPRLLECAPGSRALLLYGNLEDFLISCCKKLPGAQLPLRWMAQYLLPGTRLEQELAIPGDHELNFVEASVLVWFAQMEIYARVLAEDTSHRLRTLDMPRLLDRPEDAVEACTHWLGMVADEALPGRVGAIFARDAKRPEAPHGSERRASERAVVLQRHGDLLRAALHWAERAVAPKAILPADWKPLVIR